MKKETEKFGFWLSKTQVKFDNTINLSDFSYFKSGGSVDLILFPASQEQLIECVKALNDCEKAYKVIGETTNLIFLDDVELHTGQDLIIVKIFYQINIFKP